MKLVEEATLNMKGTYVGSIIKAFPYGCIKELGKVSDSETTISDAGWGHAPSNLLEDGSCVGLGDQ